MATGQKMLCEYCGRVYKEPATGVIACPACGGPYGIEIGEPMHEYYRNARDSDTFSRNYTMTVASTGETMDPVFFDTDARGWYST